MNKRGGHRVAVRAFLAGLTVAAALPAQTPLPRGGDGAVRIQQTDFAILEAAEPRKDLACTVLPDKPVLGFDLRFHTGYEITVPLKELAGSENTLTILFRVAPANRRDEYTYFSHRYRVPPIEEDAKGDAYLTGMFDVGEGDYHVDWLMRDRSERVCASAWDTEAVLPPKDKQVALRINPSAVEMSDGEQFREDPPVERIQSEPPLNLKLLVNFAPQKPDSAALQPADTSALVSILREIARDPHIGQFSIVAFNMQEQRILYRQDSANRIDFPALGQALNTLNLGTVDLKRLGDKHGDTAFLSELIKKEATAADDHPDALVFAGPKVLLEENVPQDDLNEVSGVEYPVFYMNYNLYPQQVPWKDSISRAVRYFKGTEYTISRPRDLWFAVNDLVSRTVRAKIGRTAMSAASK